MLKHTLLHPQITSILAETGHNGTVLIADGNYPALTKKGPNAKVVSLNLMPGVVTCDQVLQALVTAVPLERARTMMYHTTGPYALPGDPPVWDQFRKTLKAAECELALEPVEQWAFYDAVATSDHALTIQTADQQTFANLLLTIGVRLD